MVRLYISHHSLFFKEKKKRFHRNRYMGLFFVRGGSRKSYEKHSYDTNKENIRVKAGANVHVVYWIIYIVKTGLSLNPRLFATRQECRTWKWPYRCLASHLLALIASINQRKAFRLSSGYLVCKMCYYLMPLIDIL